MTNLDNYFISNKGYKIPLDNEHIKIVNECKKELFVCPFTENPIKYPVFRISDKYLYIPKYYGINKFGIPPPENIKEQIGTPINYEFNSNLRDYQIEPACKIYKHLLQNGSGIASLHTGWGKTCMSLWIAHKLGVKTLIIVHTENLLNQWIEKIELFMNITKEDIGIIQGPNLQIDKKIVIGMIQSISMKEYPKDTFKSFGLTIYDESHHTPGRCFSKIFYKIGTKYNLGLSATITRADGLTKVIKYFIGDVIVNIKQNLLIPNIYNHYTEIEPIETKTMINGKLNMPHLIGELCKSFERNLEIVKIIKEKYSQNRNILVLTDRREHCLNLQRLLGNDYSSGLYIGSMKNTALQESNTKRVIFATYLIASEGYDNPKLDTLILASPKSNIEQAVGRILRQENENEPLVIDIVDSFSVLINMHSRRMKFYKQKKFNILQNSKNISSNQEIKLDSLCINDEFI